MRADSPRFHRLRQRGFTLLEVMIAMVIFAIAALALLNAQNSQITTDQHLRDKTIAHWVALNQLAEMRLQKRFPDVGESTDTASMGNAEWQLTIKVQATPTGNVRLVIISVAPKSDTLGDKADPVTVVTGFLPRAQDTNSSAQAKSNAG
jgi:general secretion pathway protein I